MDLSHFAYLTTGLSGLASALILGTAVGFIVGLVPEIGGRIGIILCIPFATFWEPIGGAVFLFAMHSVVHTASSIPAIAFALPSTAADAATVLDGYPLAKMGRAGEALGASLSASAMGGVLGALAFIACIPIARLLMTWFGPPEFLLLALAGLSMVVMLSGRNLFTGLLTAAAGILAACVGIDVLTGATRFTLGRPELLDGLDLAAVIGGIFVIPETLTRWTFDEKGHRRAISTNLRDVAAGMRTTLAHLHLVFRSSLYGIWVGIMPGLGSSVSVWMSYAYAARHVKSDIPYGEGAIAGVIAPETANNSKEGGAMVPTLFFGIPGSSSMAIMLGAFMVIGQPVGPQLLTTDIDVSFILAIAILLANLIAIPMFFMAVPGIVRLAALRREHMVPFVIALSLFGALYQDLHWITLVQFAAGGVFGIALKWAGWSRAPFLLGFVMGPLAEISYIQTSQIWGWTMFARPGTIVMVVLFAGFAIRAMRQKADASDSRLGRANSTLALPLLLVFGLALLAAFAQPEGGSPVPKIISVIGVILAMFVVAKALIQKSPPRQEGLGAFENLAQTAAYLAAVPLIGLPLSSALYTAALTMRAKTGVFMAVACAIALALAQLLLFSLIVDISYEPLITGRLFHGLF